MSVIQWISTICSIIGFGSIFSWFVKDQIEKHRKKKQQNNDNEQILEKQKRQEETRCLIKDSLKEVSEKIDKLQEEVEGVHNQAALNTEANVTILRDRLKCSLNYCRRQGYKSPSDAANWNELFKTYTNLGGNHFREYVNSWKEEMDSLPIKDDKNKINEGE